MGVKDRVGRIGSSDVAPILGVDRFRTAYDVWEVVTGKREGFAGDEMTDLGAKLEPVVLERYWWTLEEEKGWTVVEEEELVHPKFPWFVVHPDQVLTCHGAEIRIVEAKTGGIQRESDWAAGVPEHYVPQGVALLACCDAEVCDFPVYLAPLSVRRALASLLDHGVSYDQLAHALDPFLVARLEHRRELEEMILAEVVEFWEQCVQKDLPPAPQNLDDCRRRWRKSVDRVVEATPELRDSVIRLDEARREEKALKAEIDRLKFEVSEALGDAEGLEWQGELIATWKTNRALDEGWVREHHPELYEEFCVTEKRFVASEFRAAHRKLAEQAMVAGGGARPVKTHVKAED